MSILGMLGIDPEKQTYDTVKYCLSNISEELQKTHKDFFIVIRPTDDEFNHKYYICMFDEKGNMKVVREILLKEILGKDED